MKTKTRIGLLAAVLLTGLSIQAGSFTYVWVPKPLPPLPHGGKRIVAHGEFTTDILSRVTFVAFGAGNFIAYGIQSQYGSPFPFQTGAIGSYYADIAGVVFTETRVYCVNPEGGSWDGAWSVKYNP